MPVGNFVDHDVKPCCGIVSDKEFIDEEDEPRGFYNPNRTQAQGIVFPDIHTVPNSLSAKCPISFVPFTVAQFGKSCNQKTAELIRPRSIAAFSDTTVPKENRLLVFFLSLSQACAIIMAANQ